MHPTLFTLPGGWSVRSYGLFVLLGFATALVLLVRGSRRRGVSPGLTVDLAFVLLISGLIGSRLLYLALHADRFLWACTDLEVYNRVFSPRPPLAEPSCLEAFAVWKGGLVWYGGLLGALAAGWIFCRRHHLYPAGMADLFAAPLAFGHALGRLGCFFAGCCWGKVCNLPWAVRLPPGSLAHTAQAEQGLIALDAPASLPLHPTQLYEAGGELLIGLLLLGRQRRPGSRSFPGRIALHYLLLYPLLRFLTEVFRGDEERGMLLRWGNERLNDLLGLPPGSEVLLSHGQALSLALAAAAALALFLLGRGTLLRHTVRDPK